MDFSRTRLSLTRSPLSYSKVRLAAGAVLRRWPLRKTPRDGAYLNVGCGPNPHPDFFNVDYDWHQGVDLFCDISKTWPVPSGAIAGIFTEHCLEHLTLDGTRRALREFARVLRPDGVARIIVPDGELYLRGYCEGAKLPYDEEDKNEHPHDYAAIMSVNRIFRGHGHRYIYDFAAMSAVMRHAGFHDIRRRAFRDGADPRLLIDQETRAVESLYIEGRVTRGAS